MAGLVRHISAIAARVGLVVSVAVLASACSTPLYLLRSAYEEGRILWRREPIGEVLARPEVDAETRSKLELVLAVREFARDSLGLEVGGAYGSFSEVPPGALLQVVSAAERTRLAPYEWWFPIVGRVSYKGFFSGEEALAEAKRLEARGYDTYVRGSVAFSTLGWFDDPVLSSWLRAGPVRIAGVVIHELLHRTTYLSGQTAFNESFASFVGGRGAIAFFAATRGEDAPATREARGAWRGELEESQRLAAAVRELESLYEAAARDHRPLEEVLAARRPIFAMLGDPERMNNAVVLARSAYLDRLDCFDAVYEGSGGDLRLAIERVRRASEESSDPYAALTALAGPAAAGGPAASEPGTACRGTGSQRAGAASGSAARSSRSPSGGTSPAPGNQTKSG